MRVTLVQADLDRVLPFRDDRFGAAVSRLALMIAADRSRRCESCGA